MLFNSPEFIFVFMPITLAAFVLAGRLGGSQAAVGILVVASFVFYVYWRVDDLFILTVSIAVNYVAGRSIETALNGSQAKRAKQILVLGIVFNLGLIAYFKYLGFFAGIVNTTLGTAWHTGNLALPLGISFFTFTQITFLVDVHRQRTRERSPLRYALFVTFFPHLIAGPILHQGTMSPQFQRKDFGRLFSAEVVAGLTFFVAGLFKKILLADPIGSFVGPVFDAAATSAPVTFWEAWLGVLAYTMQIYFDFSGYSDMAIGLGLMFGVRLPVNFNSPYKAVNIVDFWRRWHMTLSAFLRDYLYIPLGGNRAGALLRYRNLLITMLLGGLWHGANWTFIVWGGLHGLMICINHAWQRLKPSRLPVPAFLSSFVARALTFSCVVLAWVPFRADSMETTWRLWRVMFGAEGIPLPTRLAAMMETPTVGMFGNGLLSRGEFWLLDFVGMIDGTQQAIAAVTILLLSTMALPNTQQAVGYQPEADRLPAIVTFRYPLIVGSFAALVFWVCILSLNRPTQFLYFNF